MDGYINLKFIHLGTFLLSLVAFLYLLIIFLNLRTRSKNKELLMFFSFLAVIISDILFMNKINNQFLHTIILTASFFTISSIIFKESPKKLSDIFKKSYDLIFFAVITIGIIVSFILFHIKLQYNINVFKIKLFYLLLMIYQLLAMITFTFIFINSYINFPFKIGAKIKLLLTVYLLTYILLIFDFIFNLNFSFYTVEKNPNNLTLLEIIVLNLKTIIYILFSIFGIARIYITENKFIQQFLEFTKSKKGEFKTLDIIQSLVLESEEYDSTLENILNIGCQLTKSDGGIIYIYDKNSREFLGKKINGYVIPPFFVNDKILEDAEQINKKIESARVPVDSRLFKHIMDSDDIIMIQREGDDDSRKCLEQLRDYANNIGSLLAGKVLIDDVVYGVIILEELYSNYSDTDKNIFKAICSFSGVLIKNIQSKTMEKERERLKNEMKIAEQIQTGILPRKYSIEGYTISSLMKPADEVGGDYYDIINSPDGSYWINIGDVTGHGVTAGLIMMMLQTSSNATINAIPDISPKDLAIICNKIIFDNVQNRLLLDQFITTCFMKFTRNGFFEYSGAHEDIFIYRNATNNVEVLKTKGIWLGLMEDISHGTILNSFNLYKGDILLIYTDGVIEIRNAKNEQYDTKRLINFLKKNGNKEPDHISELLMKELELFKDVQKDDITFLVVRKD